MSAWIVETLIASTLLMGFVLMVRGAVAARFGARVAYLLWLLPAARMVLPPLPAEVVETPMASLPAAIDLNLLIALAEQPAPAESGIAWGALLLTAWLGGAAIHFGWHLLAYRRFVRSTFAESRQLPQLDRDGIEVCASPAVSGPFAAGIFVKTIVLPLDYRRRYDADELRLAMQHETEHHRRCDMSANLAALGLLSLHWFNPIAHRAHRAFRIDQELACDAIVLARATPAERHAYGSALLKSTCDRLPVAACALGAGDDLKRRLRMMGYRKPTPGQARIGVALAAVLTGGGLLLTASGGIAAEKTRAVEAQVREQVIQTVTPPPSVVAVQSVAPVPEIPAVPPVPPVPEHDFADDYDVDHEAFEQAMEDYAEARESAIEAAMESSFEAREAAMEAAREAMRVRVAIRPQEIEAIRVRALAAAPRVLRRDCETNDQPVVSSTIRERDGTSRELLVVCTNFEPIDREEMRRTMIEALEEARAEVASEQDEDLTPERRARALSSIDRQLSRLRSRD